MATQGLGRVCAVITDTSDRETDVSFVTAPGLIRGIGNPDCRLNPATVRIGEIEIDI